jgi:hypothetical protein
MRALSGKFVLRIPSPLHRKLKEEARSKGQSLNALCVHKLQNPASSALASTSAPAIGPAQEYLPEIVHHWRDELVGVVLFGSAARGEATEASDIDLLLVVNPKVSIAPSLYRRWEEWQAANCRSPNSVSPQFVRIPQNVFDAGGLWYEVAVDGHILWERDFLVSRFLSAIREEMARGRIRRGMVHGSPYWVKEFGGQNAQ